MKQKLLSLLLALALVMSLAAPALAAETAAVIRLTKTTGTVEVSKSSGKPISLLANMRLYNGYHVETAEESYAWINLDDSKLLKEDAASEVEVRKDGKKLEVQLRSGNVFFDVAEPLEDDESLNIRTSTMIVGVRGTSGWIQVVDRWRAMVSVLEGTVECTVTDPITGQLKSAEIQGGETAECVVYPREQVQQRCDILMKKYPIAEIPGFVLSDLTRDMKLCDKIEELTGLDIPRDLASVAGGDPSGRTPDRESATAEVLGEADRREDEDEADLREEMEKIEEELEKQPDNISPSKPVEKPAAPAPETPGRDDSDSDSGDSGDSGTTTPDPTPPTPPTPPQSSGMKLTDVQVQALLDAGTSVSVAPNTDAADTTPKKNTLEVDTGLTVASGKTLDLQSGIDVEVYSGKALRVDGTLTADALTNNGTTTVTSGNTLHLRGNLTTSGTLTVTSTGRVVVDGTFTNSGTVALTAGAKVLAKTFAPTTAPEGWEVSAETDADGYYSLTPSGGDTPSTPATYKVTFNANGGTIGGGPTTEVTTGENGLAPWPAEAPLYGEKPTEAAPNIGLEFVGWFDAPAGGTEYTASSVFTGNKTLYAHWNGWYIDSEGTLFIGGDGSQKDYYTELIRFPGEEYVGGPGWHRSTSDIKKAVVLEGVTSLDSGIADPAVGPFYGCSAMTSVTIPSTVTSIGGGAFAESGLTSVTIPSGVTSMGVNVFSYCPNLRSIVVDAANPSYTSAPDNVAVYSKNKTELLQLAGGYSGTYVIPSGVTSIRDWAFYRCTGLTGVTIPEGVTSIGDYAFRGCTGLTSVVIPEGITSIGDYTFYGCTGLTSLTIPAGLTSAAGVGFLNDCFGLTSIQVSGENPAYSSDGTALFNKDKTTLVRFPKGHSGPYTIPSGVTTIGRSAFSGCSLTSVTIPNSVKTIESNAFSICSHLTSINYYGTERDFNRIDKLGSEIPSGITINYITASP